MTRATLRARIRSVDEWLVRAGARITVVTGTMWVAIVFAVLALVSLPAVLASHDLIIMVSWLTQSFLQLVLLPIIIVGQNAQGAKTEQRDLETHDAVMRLLKQVHETVTSDDVDAAVDS